MNKKADGEFWLFLILLALIPMCIHAGETSYDDCVDDCIELNYNIERDNNYTKRYFHNLTEISEQKVKKYCYNECKLSVTNSQTESKDKK